MPSLSFNTEGQILIKIIEACINSADDFKSIHRAPTIRKKPTNTSIIAETKIISNKNKILYQSHSLPVITSVNIKTNIAQCLIGEEIEVENVTSNSIIIITLMYAPDSSSYLIRKTNDLQKLLGLIEIPMNRLEINSSVSFRLKF